MTTLFFTKKTWEYENFSARRLIKELPTKKWKIQTLDDFARKLRATGSIERIVMIDLKCAVYSRFLFYEVVWRHS